MFYYKVTYWDSVTQDEKTESGILAAKDYSMAANKVTDAYGADSICSLYLEQWDDVISEDEVMEGFERADVKD